MDGGDSRVQTLTLSLRTRPVVGTSLERVVTGIRVRRKQGRGSDGHFLGFWARLNCERTCQSSPHGLCEAISTIRGESPICWSGKMNATARSKRRCGWRFVGTFDDYVELKRTDESTTVLPIVWRMLPRNGGRALFLLCPHCDMPRRHVYGWEWNRFSGRSNVVMSVSWRCRSCVRLRYSSEGGYLRPSGLGRLGQLGVMLRAFGNLPRPESWLPYVFTSREEAAEAGRPKSFVALN